MSDDRKQQLIAERERTAQLFAELTGDFNSVVEAAREVATDDEHDPEGAGIAYERSQVDAVLAMVRSRLAALDVALARLHDGDDGRCGVCGGPIGVERLEVQPATTTCVTCATPRRRPLRR